ncbi:hypothetical protein HYC85_028136 [Camellia sinensis]|uniref:Uncharacterized protein n=1 Tax=Camellia sinensis TaxID=4442 RepID=A0A7J7FUC9_CAMSI|nr:hypothetical protein HYC85_028136 [Camellia sinensis]
MNEIMFVNMSIEKDLGFIQIGSTLSLEEPEQLVALLKNFKKCFAWFCENMNGIDLEIMQHRITLGLET